MKFVKGFKRKKAKISVFLLILVGGAILAVSAFLSQSPSQIQEAQSQGCIGPGGSGCTIAADCCLVGASCFLPGDLPDIPANHFCCGPYGSPPSTCGAADLTDSVDDASQDVNVADAVMCTNLYSTTPSCAQYECFDKVGYWFGKQCCSTDRCLDYYSALTDYSTCDIGCGGDSQVGSFSSGSGCSTCYCCDGGGGGNTCNTANCLAAGPPFDNADYAACGGCSIGDNLLGSLFAGNCSDTSCECCEIGALNSVGHIRVQGPSGLIKLNLISTADAIAEGKGVIKVALPGGQIGAAYLSETDQLGTSPVRVQTPFGTKAWLPLP